MTSIYRHRKRGSTYSVLGRAVVQASTGPLQEGQSAIVYAAESDGSLHVRAAHEFHDGRFEDVTPARQWWPSAYMDEVLPEGEFSPDQWLVGPTDDAWLIAPKDRHDARSYGCILVAPGEEVGFSWSEPRGRAQMLIYPDATWHVEGGVPADWTHVYDVDDPLSADESMDAFARNWRDNEGVWSGDEPIGLTVKFIKWGDARFRLEAEDRTARFVPVETAAPAEVGGEA